MTDIRKQSLAQWAIVNLGQLESSEAVIPEMESVSGDASFRRYFRLRSAVTGKTWVAVDAPPENEDSDQFIAIANLFAEAGARVPAILAADLTQGFMLLQDFGDQLYLPLLLEDQALMSKEAWPSTIPPKRTHDLYQGAMAALVKLQCQSNEGNEGNLTGNLPRYDESKLLLEMNLFPEWFCQYLCGLELGVGERQLLETTFQFLASSALTQPQVIVHRDYHSRNLMVLPQTIGGEDGSPGMIDFQDAVLGAYSYDLVSLLRDCYIRWPDTLVCQWALDYKMLAVTHGVLPNSYSDEQFLRDFDLMGLQRHFKVMGIFARLAIRDNKPTYLADIPLVINYFSDVAKHYAELDDFMTWFEQRVLPVATEKLAGLGNSDA